MRESRRLPFFHGPGSPRLERRRDPFSFWATLRAGEGAEALLPACMEPFPWDRPTEVFRISSVMLNPPVPKSGIIRKNRNPPCNAQMNRHCGEDSVMVLHYLLSTLTLSKCFTFEKTHTSMALCSLTQHFLYSSVALASDVYALL